MCSTSLLRETYSEKSASTCTSSLSSRDKDVDDDAAAVVCPLAKAIQSADTIVRSICWAGEVLVGALAGRTHKV